MKPNPLPQHFALPKSIQALVDDGHLRRDSIRQILTIPEPTYTVYLAEIRLHSGRTILWEIFPPYA